jgi:cobalt-zinc-cadmium efflux system outer membrane protein
MLLRKLGICAGVATAMLFAGCRSSQKTAASGYTPDREPPVLSFAEADQHGTAIDQSESLMTVSQETTELAPAVIATEPDDPFANDVQLQLESLVAMVRARNPSLQAANAAWSAAAERYPQAVAFDDPMMQTMFAPATFASGSPTQSSYVLGVAQRVPWHGKRALRGQIAEWDATAASWDASEVQLRLEAAARIAFFDYYLVQRELELNQKNVEVTQDSRSTAKSKYEANQVSEQDLSLADLELAKLEQERLELNRAELIAIARINTLIHRTPGHPIPPAPHELEIVQDQQDVDSLRETALQQRPELAALSAKIQSEQAAVALACKEYYPDFEFMGRYDSFWTDTVQRPMVGMNMNIPLNRDRRGAAVREAQCRVTKLLAERAQQEDMVREEVQIAYARVEASKQASVLYNKRVLPAAEANLASARSAYVAGSIDFLSLMSARREFITQQIGYQRTLAEYHRSRADLERAVGTPLKASGLPEHSIRTDD